MKRFFFLLSLLSISALLFAQSDTIHTAFKAKHFGFIVGGSLSVGLKDADVQKVFNDVAAQLELKDSAGKKWVKDTAQLIYITPKVETIPKLFLMLGSLQERQATNYNNEMREMLMKDLYRRPDVLEKVQALMEGNARETWELVQYGFDYLITIKP